MAVPSLSAALGGDPVQAGPAVADASGIARLAGIEAVAAPVMLPLAPGAVALLAPVADGRAPAATWVRLPHHPRLVPDANGTEVALVLSAPPARIGAAVQLVARARACFRADALVERARAVRTHEELVGLLAPLEAEAGESALAAEELYTLLGSGPAGLSETEAARRLAACGPNRLQRVARRSLLSRFLAQFTGFFALLLWVGGGLAFLAGMPQLGWAILAVIAVNGAGSFLQEYRAERAVEAIESLLPHDITVVREGRPARRPTTALVPGDVVRVEEGEQVPADGQLVDAAGLRVDQSALTGESHPVFKLPAAGNERERVPRPERHELLFAGTGVVAGAGTLLVTATAMATEIGAIAHLTQAVGDAPSPLQREMARVSRTITVIALMLGGAFFAAGVLTGLLSAGEGLAFALGIIVANVPEGLLPTLTLALALGVQRLARQGSVMKRLSAVETLGATSVICTDKTGTLTRNVMTARLAWAGGRGVELEGAAGPCAGAARALLEAAVLASQATAERGDPTEVALVRAAAAAGVDVEGLREGHALRVPYPFDSFRKRMTLVRTDDGRATAYTKGAPRETLALCTHGEGPAGVMPLTDADRRTILDEHDRMAASGLRLLAVATRHLPDALGGGSARAVERELTFLGLIALWDPPRPEVEGAIALCRRAGIRVVMITGDYGLTARAIAAQVGLPIREVVSGEELDRLGPDSLRALLREEGVLFARTSPEHKLRIVRELRGLGEIVAVTGDGVNDAPALKAADIGVAMGRRGSDVAKEAAEMVITDDNFASIVAAVRQGRATYANLGKFVTYILASNVPELVPFLAFVLLGIPLPLTVMQILAVDLGTDLLPALALGAEPAEPDVMDRPPRPREERLLDRGRLLRAYGFLGVAEAALSLGAFFWTYWLAGWRPGRAVAAEGPLYRRATSMTLVGIVAAQVGNVFACRTDRESVLRAGLLGNRLVLLGVAAEILVLLALLLVPPLADVFGLAAPGLREWAPTLAFPPLMILIEEGRKWLVRRARDRRGDGGPQSTVPSSSHGSRSRGRGTPGS